MTRKVISSTITVPLISMTPAAAARNISISLYLLLGDVGQEYEAEGEVDEVHRLDQTDDGEEPRDHASLCFGLTRNAADEGVARESVATGSAEGARGHSETQCDQCRGETRAGR